MNIDMPYKWKERCTLYTVCVVTTFFPLYSSMDKRLSMLDRNLKDMCVRMQLFGTILITGCSKYACIPKAAYSSKRFIHRLDEMEVAW